MRKFSTPPVVSLVTLTCVDFDQSTRFAAKRFLAPDGFLRCAGDIFRLRYAKNTGALLSLGASLPDPWRQLVFTALVGMFLLGLLGYLLLNRSLAGLAVHCLSWIFAGGASNLIDRIAYDGRVVDFLKVGIGHCVPGFSISPTWRSRSVQCSSRSKAFGKESQNSLPSYQSLAMII